MPQTSYAINIPAQTYPGQIADNGPKDVKSGMAVAAAISYGLLCVVDTTNSNGFDNLAVKVPAASTDITTLSKAVGVSLADQARAQDPSVATAQYPRYSAVPCLRMGRVWVQSESAVADGAPVYARWQTGDGGTVAGKFSGVLDTSVVGNALLANSTWRGKTTGAGFAVLEVNLN